MWVLFFKKGLIKKLQQHGHIQNNINLYFQLNPILLDILVYYADENISLPQICFDVEFINKDEENISFASCFSPQLIMFKI